MKQSFVDWVDDGGMWIKKGWDIKNNRPTSSALLQLFPHQRDILGHCLTPNDEGILPYQTIIYSCPKKSGKTQIGAAIGAWYADCGEDESEIYAIANDKEQASRIFGDMRYHYTKKGIGHLKADSITLENGTFIQTLAQHYASAAGARQALTLWDELWAYIHERSQLMWAEMTPPPTVRNTLRVVVTYAGIEGQTISPLLDLYNKAFKMEKGRYVAGEVVPELEHIVDIRGNPVCRRDPEAGLFVYWDTEARMPWQTKTYYKQQLQTLRPTDFLRQHKNQWVSSSEDFIPIALWDASVTLTAPITTNRGQEHGNLPLFIGVDIGMKHDCSAAVAVSYDSESGKVYLCDHRIWTPQGNDSLDLEATVEAYLKFMNTNYYVKMVSYDPSQFQRSASELHRSGIPMVEYTQTVTNMTLATQALYSVLNTGMFNSYKAEELRDHIRFSRVSVTTRGMRIVKDKNAMYKIDAAIALAMAVKSALGFGDVGQRDSIKIISPFSDLSSTHIPTIKELLEERLPEELRT